MKPSEGPEGVKQAIQPEASSGKEKGSDAGPRNLCSSETNQLEAVEAGDRGNMG